MNPSELDWYLVVLSTATKHYLALNEKRLMTAGYIYIELKYGVTAKNLGRL